MIKFIGTKIVHATPAIKKGSKVYLPGEAIPRSMEPVEHGYKVKYEDGYTSWSPKDVFEKAYRETNGVPFGLALEAAKMGLSFRHPDWYINTKVCMQVPDKYSKMTSEYLYMTTDSGNSPWIPTMAEMLSDDWIVL